MYTTITTAVILRICLLYVMYAGGYGCRPEIISCVSCSMAELDTSISKLFIVVVLNILYIFPCKGGQPTISWGICLQKTLEAFGTIPWKGKKGWKWIAFGVVVKDGQEGLCR